MAALHSEAGTFHACAAAVTSICLPAAPTRRSVSQLLGVARLPPANWSPKRAGSLGACSTVTSAQSASSSSAISIGSIVFTRSEEHTSELQSQFHLVCRLLLEKKKTRT